MNRYSDIQRKYEKWWLFKYLPDGRWIIKVKYLGNRVCGQVYLTLNDGTETHAPQGAYDHQPRKKNFEVFDENPITVSPKERKTDAAIIMWAFCFRATDCFFFQTNSSPILFNLARPI